MTLPVPAGPLAAGDYAEFKRRLAASGCSLCPALCAARTNIVVDRGTPAARILIVGEAPGANEDLEGRAFVGRSGKLLDALFADAGLSTDRDALIVNVVKCRPPGNRPPTPVEAANCRPYLMRQIELVRPKAVVMLGATAARRLLPADERPMKDRVGTLFEHPAWPGVLLQILYHPAFLLRDPRRKPEAAAHVRTLRQGLEAAGLVRPKIAFPIGGNRE